MPERAVLQPNGRYAIFSTNVDTFTCYDATREELLDVFLKDFTETARMNAEGKITRAESRGVEQFYAELATIGMVHGFAESERLKALLSDPVRDARSVPPQAEKPYDGCANYGPWPRVEHQWTESRPQLGGIQTTRHCQRCGLQETTQTGKPLLPRETARNHSTGMPPDPHHARDVSAVEDWLRAQHFAAFKEVPVNHSTGPLVKPERVTAIKAFKRSLELLCECYGVKLKPDTDYSGDLLILDQTRQIPAGYYFDARITPEGELEIANWVLDEEGGATGQ